MASTNHGTLKWSPYNHVQQQNGTPMRSSPLVAQSQYPQPNGSGGLYPAFARRVMFQAEQLDHLRPRYEALFGVAEPLTTIVFSHGGRTYHFCGFAGEIAPRQDTTCLGTNYNVSSPQPFSQQYNHWPIRGHLNTAVPLATQAYTDPPQGSFHESFMLAPEEVNHGYPRQPTVFASPPSHVTMATKSAFSPHNRAIRSHQNLSRPGPRDAPYHSTAPKPIQPFPGTQVMHGISKEDPPIQQHGLPEKDPPSQQEETDQPVTKHESDSKHDEPTKEAKDKKATLTSLDNGINMILANCESTSARATPSNQMPEAEQAVKYRVCPLKKGLSDLPIKHKPVPYEYERK